MHKSYVRLLNHSGTLTLNMQDNISNIQKLTSIFTKETYNFYASFFASFAASIKFNDLFVFKQPPLVENKINSSPFFQELRFVSGKNS